MLPVVNDLAKRVGAAPSQLLLPLSYAAILGGMCTLIGTSTNHTSR
jgi:di/tricarboxylate transporter